MEASKKRHRDSPGEASSSTRALREALQCPVCYCMMAPPITQCQQGHALCNVCYGCVGKCPTCRIELPETPIRSLPLEQLAANIRVPCKHRGCAHVLEYASFARHVAQCEKRPFRCPFVRSTSKRARPSAAPRGAAADDAADASDAPPEEASPRRPPPAAGDPRPADAMDDADEDLAPIDEAHVVREMERYIAELETARGGGGGDLGARRPSGDGGAPPPRGPPPPPVTRPNDVALERSEDACAWEGGVEEIVDHLVHFHGVHVERSVDVLDDGVRYLVEDTEGTGECTWGPWLARDAAGRHYLLRVEQRNGSIFAAGQLVGDDAALRAVEDKGVLMKITAFSPKRNVSYESPPTSLRSDFRHLRRTGDGLWLSRGQVQLIGERPPQAQRQPKAGAKPVRLTLWFETVSPDVDGALDDETNAALYADEPRGGGDDATRRAAAADDDDADLERALAPMHVSTGREPAERRPKAAS